MLQRQRQVFWVIIECDKTAVYDHMPTSLMFWCQSWVNVSGIRIIVTTEQYIGLLLIILNRPKIFCSLLSLLNICIELAFGFVMTILNVIRLRSTISSLPWDDHTFRFSQFVHTSLTSYIPWITLQKFSTVTFRFVHSLP